MLTRHSGGDGAFTDPYRLWNLDVFEYEADSEMALYGAIPFMHAHRPGSTVALFSLTGSENWIDITKSGKATHTHWMAESGIIDLLIFLGPTNGEVFESYGQLTGMTALPQMFAIGHHQCRWNYLNQQDVKEVSERFDEYDIPMDVLWLDIEYAEDVSHSQLKAFSTKVDVHLSAAQVLHLGKSQLPRAGEDAGRPGCCRSTASSYCRSAHQAHVGPLCIQGGSRSRYPLQEGRRKDRIRRMVLDRLFVLGRLLQSDCYELVDRSLQV